jgi:CBS domain containing-hemolysin-like protein
MNDYLLAFIFLVLAVAGIIVRKAYYFLPVHEWKRRAGHDDHVAERLYPAVAYGGSLRALLWLYIGFTAAASIILLARALPIWVSLLIVGPLLWIAFSWLPASRTSSIGIRLAFLVTPLVIFLLGILNPLLGRGTGLIQNHAHLDEHTGLFEKDDLIEFVEQQQRQTDSRLSDHELEVVRRALRFNEFKVHDVLIPRKKVKIVLSKDTVGPILIDELHKNGQSHVLVRQTPKGHFAGTLAFKDLDIHSSGKVQDFMDKNIFYVHVDDSLNQVLGAFFVTHQPLFVVVNSFEEFVGIVTVEGILRQLFGEINADDFEQYGEPAAVAARHPKKHEKQKKSEPAEDTPVKTE